MKLALITGVTGQDGSYLSELLLDKGYEVYGLVRRTSGGPSDILERLHRERGLKFIYGDLHDAASVRRAIEIATPDEVYNLASQSHIAVSFECPEDTWDINCTGAGYVITEALKANKNMRIYQASSSEMFGTTPPPQDESSLFVPVSPYAQAKVRAHQEYVVKNRQDVGAYVCSGILFNHESPRRGKHFVTRKITVSLAKIKLGLQDCLELGNLNAKRDWGYAKEYVTAMHSMLQLNAPEDFVVATGVQHTVREFVETAASVLGIPIRWEGSGENEIGRDASGKVIVRVNPKFFRAHEVNDLVGNASKAKRVLGWEPRITFSELVSMMVKYDYDTLSGPRTPSNV